MLSLLSHGPMGGRSPMIMGLIYGVVHVVGPDHLGTLMTLSSVTSSQSAFKVGAAWGLGHSVGMVIVAMLFLVLHQLVTIDVEKWEHYGNYFIGASMILCGFYFIYREGLFLHQRADGTFVPQACSCHGTVTMHRRPRRDGLPRSGKKFCASYCEKAEDAEKQPLVPNMECGEQEFAPEDDRFPGIPGVPVLEPDQPKSWWWNSVMAERDMKSAMLGVFQGICCPLGMVGITFLANLEVSGVLGFLVIFLLISAFGTATLAVCWAALTRSGTGICVSPRIMYRVSCGFTLSLGIAWIVTNYTGVLEKLDYTESMHR